MKVFTAHARKHVDTLCSALWKPDQKDYCHVSEGERCIFLDAHVKNSLVVFVSVSWQTDQINCQLIITVPPVGIRLRFLILFLCSFFYFSCATTVEALSFSWQGSWGLDAKGEKQNHCLKSEKALVSPFTVLAKHPLSIGRDEGRCSWEVTSELFNETAANEG